MRGEPLLAALALASLSCTWEGPAAPPPALEAVVPNPIPAGVATVLTLQGQRLYAALSPRLGSLAPHPVDYGFEVRVGNLSISGGAVRFVDSTRLEVDVPALSDGVYDVTVRTPSGQEASLPGALEVLAAPKAHRLIFLSPPQRIRAGECSGALQVELRDEAGLPAVVTRDTSFKVWAGDYRVQLFGDPGCAERVGKVPLPAGEASAAFYAVGLLVGETTVNVRWEDLVAAQAIRFAPTRRCDLAGLPEGIACDDGRACTTAETCAAGACVAADSSACPSSRPPVACLVARPPAAAPQAPIVFDSRCSRDADHLAVQLEARWDFDADGTWDTPRGPLGEASWTYEAAGAYEPLVEVTDPDGAAAQAQRMVIVSPWVVQVTTPADEADDAATPQAPGQTGFSLREAIAWADRRNDPTTILVPEGMQLTSGALPELDEEGSAIVGGAGAGVDFQSASGASCLVLGEAGQRVVGLHLKGCGSHLVELKEEGDQVVDCVLEGPLGSLKVDGPGAIVGPRNELRDFTDQAIQVKGPGVTILGNRFTRNGGEVISLMQDSGAGQLIARNVFFENPGVAIGLFGQPGFTAWFNTFHRNASDAIRAVSPTTPIDLRNNVFSENAGAAMAVPPQMLSHVTPNAFFANGGGVCPGLSAQPGWVLAPPGFWDGLTGDLRPTWQSPLIDAGDDLGMDVNGPAPWDYWGLGPDLGAHETP